MIDQIATVEGDTNLTITLDNNTGVVAHSMFKENIGQKVDSIFYYANLFNAAVGFGISEVSYVVNDHFFQVSFPGSHAVRPQGVDRLNSYSNYFLGNQSHTKVGHYKQVEFKNIFDGINLLYKFTAEGLKYDFILQPQADVSQIKMVYSGLDNIYVEPQRVTLTRGDLTFFDDSLKAWYADNKEEIPISFTTTPSSAETAFPSESSKIIQFSLPENYNHSRTIVIDPLVLGYSTYLGGSYNDAAYGITLDSSNNAYITGFTYSTNFPDINAYNATGDQDTSKADAFVSKLSADGSELLYSTFLGGSEGDFGESIVLDSANNAYVTGITKSTDFPTVNAYNATGDGDPNQNDIFVVKLSADGSELLYSTYISGSRYDESYAIAIDNSNNTYVTGKTRSADFPTVNAYNATGDQDISIYDVFVFKLSADGSELLYSTYLNGSEDDSATGIVLDSSNNAYITGSTKSTDFPTVNAYNATGDQDTSRSDAFIAKLSADGSSLLYSTYLGGSDSDGGSAITLDGSNVAYIAGYTSSTDFPTVNAYNATGDQDLSRSDGFVAKISSDGSSLIYSTYLSGTSSEGCEGIAIDSSDNIYVSGTTFSGDFPTVNAYDPIGDQDPSWRDAFVAKLSADGSELLYSTYLSGSQEEWGHKIVLDSSNNAYMAGRSSSTDFPTVNAYDATGDGTWWDAAIVKIIDDRVEPTIELMTPANETIHQPGLTIDLNVTDLTLDNVDYKWDTDSWANLPSPYDLTLPSGDGDHVLQINASDQAGNWIVNTFVFTTDGENPLITLVSPDDGTVHKSNTAINLTISDLYLNTVMYNWDSESWTVFPSPYDLTLPSGDGEHTLQINASDIAGNWIIETYVFTTDDTPPLIALITPVNESIHQSNSVIDLTISDIDLDIVTYKWDTDSWTTLPSPYDPTLPSGDGVHRLEINATDRLGHWIVITYMFTTDDTVPSIILNSPANESVHSSNTIIDLTVSDTNLDTVMYKWDYNTWTVFPSPYDLTLPSGDGNHLLFINATDEAGNWIVRTYVFTTDDTEPSTSITSGTTKTRETTQVTTTTTMMSEPGSGASPGELIILIFFGGTVAAIGTLGIYRWRRKIKGKK